VTSTAQSIRDRVRKAIKGQKQKTVTVLSCLLAVEDELGWIPEEAVEEVAEFTQATINDVWGVVSFYMNFQTQPPGKHRMEICWGPTCHLVGAQRITDQVLQSLGLPNEGTTPDGLVTLRYNTCLGACANAPVISVDHHLMGRMTPSRAAEVTGRVKKGESIGGGHAS
jgi:NADH:ubiquinone oxidoreductase subunit E